MDRIGLSFEALQLLTGVDDHGGLSAASRELQMSQPNASRAIRKLERTLGVPLLQRKPTGSTLTPQGTVIAHWARTVLTDTEQLLHVARGLQSESSAELTVSASMTVAEHLMPHWLGLFRHAHPETTVHLLVNNSTQVFDKLRHSECDIGFVESPTVPAGLHSVTVAHDRLVVVVPAGHKWTRRRKPLSAAELAATSLIVREPGSGTRTTLDVALHGYPTARPLLELGSAAAIRTSVLNGMGPAVVSTLAVTDQVDAGTLVIVEVEELDLTRVLRAVWRPPRRLSGPAAELVQLIRAANR